MLDAATESATPQTQVAGEPCVLLKLGELVLKG
ncbi:MAG: hypothetical protein JWN00_1243, partial [Actinomycetia bacterium]|nr:hypothetical protein [Actinomycetes bacterium]